MPVYTDKKNILFMKETGMQAAKAGIESRGKGRFSYGFI